LASGKESVSSHARMSTTPYPLPSTWDLRNLLVIGKEEHLGGGTVEQVVDGRKVVRLRHQLANGLPSPC
jgi:hypothetical protein